ncbi:MAG TPA: hypothetical protein DHW71_01035 [Gammaproteobacteria bacterium]|nr:hypothetical protein [Gammaproteobacteria bacterium]MEC8009864.1 hypothetical protein [Pseudomonadota bacterium]HBF07387.1 hypothetical protein [Gammaproteobacteria bacterium]HCK91534.1 hypothetical protein [Gammaproteobacteria bacterium]|tara:strand:+ start:1549 stop:1842 length:294 start_codon:yes stop_codon:yes gene_type:complete
MQNYPIIRNLFISIFSVDVGLEQSEETAALERVLSDPIQRMEVEVELRQLFQDSCISWLELLDNSEYVVYPADDEMDAKEHIIDILWKKVFPGESAP